MRKNLLLFVFVLHTITAFAQTNLNYYLPDSNQYNPQIPTPKSVLGYEIGEWHLTHDQLVHYLEVIASMSDRIKMEEYGRTHEHRPLMLMTITSPKNFQNLKRIKEEHLNLTNPQNATNLNTENMPAVIYMGYSIHGNEASGGNAAALVAYYLAAAKGDAIEKILENTIILLDPCYNPDGFQRFSTWVNMHKGKNLVSDPNSREFSEPFPQGRTNHYWFDLNRDWLFAQQPESKARLAKFQEWKPNVLTDHHEMGGNSSFFFQPGVPSRINPITPKQNYDLTAEIGNFHAKALDNLGSLYYTKENFDDFYYGKGSTYPDLNGGVGILFEQASSRGKSQETTNGILNFSFTIRNHFTTSLSTLRAVQSMRKKLLDYQRDFYKNAPKENGCYVFGDALDAYKNYHFLEILQRHQIEVYQLKQDFKVSDKQFKKEKSYYVPMNQPQIRLVKTIFETQTQFEDSLFYDISAWTLPFAFNLPFARANTLPNGEKLEKMALPIGKITNKETQVGYLFHWNSYYAPRAVNRLLQSDLKLKVCTEKSSLKSENQKIETQYGSIFIPLGLQKINKEQVKKLVEEIAFKDGIDIYGLETGLADTGVDLGSDENKTLINPSILLVVGNGVNANDVGEAWHLLDTRYDMQVALIEQDRLNSIALNRYNTMVMVSGTYNQIDKTGIDNIKNWLRQGNTLICLESANNWLKAVDIANITFKTLPSIDSTKNLQYIDKDKARGAQQIGGAIFEANIDITHPLCYGYQGKTLPLFKANTLFAKKANTALQTPLMYHNKPLLSGYISKENLNLLKDTPAVLVNFFGRGQVISFVENPNFRAFWYGTNTLFANAIFFGKLISR